MFQIEVIDGGPQVFSILSSREKHQNTLNWIQSQFSNENILNTLNEAGKTFYTGMQSVFDSINSSEAMHRARLAMKKTANIFKPDIVYNLFLIEDIQSAQPVMQRWIMANPAIRQLYHDQGCDGYSDSYVDMHPGMIGEDHYDYRRVMNGIIIDDPEHDWRCTHYLDELYEGDRELDFDEQLDILSTWECVEAYLKAGRYDPTSPFGNSL